jgi:hypothetical protein
MSGRGASTPSRWTPWTPPKLHASCTICGGSGYIHRVYSDNHRSLRKACQMLGIMWEASQPGVRQTNARIERCSQDVLEGSRTLLVQAGLPSLFWPYATRCYCHHSNCALREDGASAWFRRHGSHFQGRTIPAGLWRFFLPTSGRAQVSKADPKMVWEFFLGYRLHQGGAGTVSIWQWSLPSSWISL